MSKFSENDMANQPQEKKRLELALLEVAWNVLSTNVEWKTPRAVAVNMSETALIMRGADLATVQAYE